MSMWSACALLVSSKPQLAFSTVKIQSVESNEVDIELSLGFEGPRVAENCARNGIDTHFIDEESGSGLVLQTI